MEKGSLFGLPSRGEIGLVFLVRLALAGGYILLWRLIILEALEIQGAFGSLYHFHLLRFREFFVTRFG